MRSDGKNMFSAKIRSLIVILPGKAPADFTGKASYRRGKHLGSTLQSFAYTIEASIYKLARVAAPTQSLRHPTLASFDLGEELQYVLPRVIRALAVRIRQPARGLEVLGDGMEDER